MRAKTDRSDSCRASSSRARRGRMVFPGSPPSAACRISDSRGWILGRNFSFFARGRPARAKPAKPRLTQLRRREKLSGIAGRPIQGFPPSCLPGAGEHVQLQQLHFARLLSGWMDMDREDKRYMRDIARSRIIRRSRRAVDKTTSSLLLRMQGPGQPIGLPGDQQGVANMRHPSLPPIWPGHGSC